MLKVITTLSSHIALFPKGQDNKKTNDVFDTVMGKEKNAEELRLAENYKGEKNWLQWGPYMSERQWGTVREDYSAHGTAWDYFPHDHARSRVYRWGEDGIAGLCDRHCAICFSIALWNGNDPILKERLFGLNNAEGNHGEDCKELYYYLDSSPTHSYMKHLYKYPQRAYPYDDLVHTNRRRGKDMAEYELLDTGAFAENRYFDVFTEYAKADEEDILIRITVHNRGPEAQPITVLPTLWLRNLWSFNQAMGKHEIRREEVGRTYGVVRLEHPKLGEYRLHFQNPKKWLFTGNETNTERMMGFANDTPYVKDLFHQVVIENDFTLTDAVDKGTKFAPMYQEDVPPGTPLEIRLRFSKNEQSKSSLTKEFDTIFQLRQEECDAFYAPFKKGSCGDTANIQRQAFAGMLWSKQYYNIDMETWMRGDPGHPEPPEERWKGRNHKWMTLNNEDIVSMPDKWEYPWYAAWDLAFHCVPLAMLDATFAKDQLILITREWYMAPNGQIPAYEWHFSDVNPPVQAWAAFQVYEIDRERNGHADIEFLKRIFNKLSLNFTWWVNQKDRNGHNVFEGGFLGLDNIGVFDRSNQIPGGGYLEQADGTAWMAMYALNMLQIAMEIATVDHTYEDMCTKYLEHFVHIAAALNRMGGNWFGSWDDMQGFFYDVLVQPHRKEKYVAIKVRSLVGLMALNSVLVLEHERIKELKQFYQGLKWFINYRKKNGLFQVIEEFEEGEDVLLSLAPRDRMKKLLEALLDEREFLGPFGIRALSKLHETPYHVILDGREFEVRYDPAESTTEVFGGNSNWRGPIWMPMNFLFVRSLLEYHKYYGANFKIAFPTGSGERLDLKQISDRINQRLNDLFKKDKNGDRPVNALHREWYRDPNFKDLVLFYEYFHGDNGRGVGAGHQTGWTGIIAHLIDQSCWQGTNHQG